MRAFTGLTVAVYYPIRPCSPAFNGSAMQTCAPSRFPFSSVPSPSTHHILLSAAPARIAPCTDYALPRQDQAGCLSCHTLMPPTSLVDLLLQRTSPQTDQRTGLKTVGQGSLTACGHSMLAGPRASPMRCHAWLSHNRPASRNHA